MLFPIFAIILSLIFEKAILYELKKKIKKTKINLNFIYFAGVAIVPKGEKVILKIKESSGSKSRSL